MCNITRLMTRMLHMDSVGYDLNLLILIRLNIVTLYLTLTWCLKERCLSIQAPKFLMTSALYTDTPFMLIWCVTHLLSWYLDPNIMNSVFPSFIFNQLPSIQDLILVAYCSKSLIVFTSHSLELPGNPFLYAWSSAKLCKSMGLLELNCQLLSNSGGRFWVVVSPGCNNGSCMTSLNVLAYAEYRVGPAQDPCRTKNGRSTRPDLLSPTCTLDWQGLRYKPTILRWLDQCQIFPQYSQ